MSHRHAAALCLALTSLPVAAQDHADHGDAGSAYAEINNQMHGAMDIEPSGDPDVDFIRGMIPHHEGAVDMARYVLEHGADPEVRKLAQAIIDSQEAEIAWMNEWLAENAPASGQ